MSEMDVSRVDPEEAVVDFQTVEDGDVSAEIDEAALADYGKEDKVLVSIRCVVIVLLLHFEPRTIPIPGSWTALGVSRLCRRFNVACRPPEGMSGCAASIYNGPQFPSYAFLVESHLAAACLVAFRRHALCPTKGGGGAGSP